MRIVLDVNFPFEYAAGLEVWIEGFIDGLSSVDTENHYLIFGFFMRNFEERVKKINIPQKGNFRLFVKRAPRPIVTFFEDHNISIIEKWLAGQSVDIFHGTSYFLPCLKKIKGIVTIHGLDFAEMNTYWYSDKWYKNVGIYLKRADIIIAVSEYVKKSITKHYNISGNTIKVVYPGIRKDFRFHNDPDNTKILMRFKISRPYFLTVATSVERKNLKRLLDAFKIFSEKEKDLNLVIVGGPNIHNNLLQKIQQQKLQDRIIFPGYLDAESLAFLYNYAEAFVFPSLYEGFGLPVLEAMVCGCPVITSSVSALPEITKGAALLIDPYKVDELAEAMEKILRDKDLRERLRREGLKRAKEFSWQKSARQIIEIYKEVAEIE